MATPAGDAEMVRAVMEHRLRGLHHAASATHTRPIPVDAFRQSGDMVTVGRVFPANAGGCGPVVQLDEK